VIPAVERDNFDVVAQLAHALPGAAYTLGIHPLYVDRAEPDDLTALRAAVPAALDDPRFVGIGEIGLDHFVLGIDHGRQMHFFVEQLRIAREFDLPVILHVRRAQDVMLRELRRSGVRGGIAHAFNGSVQQAEGFLAAGFALGFGGAMTFERARRIRGLVRTLGPEAHVLETDAPDIPPAWIRDGRNSPEELPRIAAEFAALREVDLAQAAADTEANARRALPRLANVL